jgi:dTDP-4-amino-4,6-dideoxygalactose transaminase
VHGPGLAQRTRQQTLHGPNQRIPARWRQGRQTKSSDAAGINAQGVPCYQGSCSEVYLEKAFDGTGWRPQDRFPVAKALGETTLMFLVHPTLTVDDMNRSVNAITSVLKEASR